MEQWEKVGRRTRDVRAEDADGGCGRLPAGVKTSFLGMSTDSTDMLFIITSSGDEFLKNVNIDDLE